MNDAQQSYVARHHLIFLLVCFCSEIKPSILPLFVASSFAYYHWNKLRCDCCTFYFSFSPFIAHTGNVGLLQHTGWMHPAILYARSRKLFVKRCDIWKMMHWLMQTITIVNDKSTIFSTAAKCTHTSKISQRCPLENLGWHSDRVYWKKYKSVRRKHILMLMRQDPNMF